MSVVIDEKNLASGSLQSALIISRELVPVHYDPLRADFAGEGGGLPGVFLGSWLRSWRRGNGT
jgi:hypothetical protein